MCGTVPGHVHAVTHIVLYSLNTFSSILMEGNFREYWGFIEHFAAWQWHKWLRRTLAVSLNLCPLWTTLSTRLSNSRCNEVGKKHGVIYVLLLFNSLVCKRTPNCGEEEGGKPLFCLCSSSNVSSHPFFSIATLFYTCTYFSRAIVIYFNFAFMVATPVKWIFLLQLRRLSPIVFLSC